MRPRFFPSRRLTAYLAKLFLTRTAGVMLGLLLILLTLDLLGQSGDILATPGNSQATLLRYAGLRGPGIVQTFLPFAVLLGTLVMLLQLNGNSEVVAMKASGLSAHQILAPMIACGLGVAALSLVFAERVAAPAAAKLEAWQAVDYAPVIPPDGAQTNVFVRAGDDIVRAGTVLGRGPGTQLRDVAVFERQAGTLHHLTRAPTARFAPDGALVLADARTFDVASGATARPRTLRLIGLSSDQFTLASVRPEQMTAGELAAAIRQLEASGRPTAQLRPGWWHKFSAPVVGRADAANGRRRWFRPGALGAAVRACGPCARFHACRFHACGAVQARARGGRNGVSCARAREVIAFASFGGLRCTHRAEGFAQHEADTRE